MAAFARQELRGAVQEEIDIPIHPSNHLCPLLLPFVES